MTTPSATTASHDRASFWAITGNSTAPATRATVTSEIPHALAAASERSSSWSVISWCQRLATTPSVSPAASTVDRSGEPYPAMYSGQPFVEFQQVAHPVPLGPQVPHVLRVRPGGQRYPPHHPQTVPLQPGPLGRIVGEQPHRANAEVVEDLRAGAVVPGIRRQPQPQVRVHGIHSGVLELVGAQLLQQPDPPALVAADVEHDAPSLGDDRAQRRVQLRAAVAPQRAEHVAGEALGVRRTSTSCPSPRSPWTSAICS